MTTAPATVGAWGATVLWSSLSAVFASPSKLSLLVDFWLLPGVLPCAPLAERHRASESKLPLAAFVARLPAVLTTSKSSARQETLAKVKALMPQRAENHMHTSSWHSNICDDMQVRLQTLGAKFVIMVA